MLLYDFCMEVTTMDEDRERRKQLIRKLEDLLDQTDIATIECVIGFVEEIV